MVELKVRHVPVLVLVNLVFVYLLLSGGGSASSTKKNSKSDVPTSSQEDPVEITGPKGRKAGTFDVDDYDDDSPVDFDDSTVDDASAPQADDSDMQMSPKIDPMAFWDSIHEMVDSLTDVSTGYGSHLYILLVAIFNKHGPVLSLGVDQELLHLLSRVLNSCDRDLVSAHSDPAMINKLKKMNIPRHDVITVDVDPESVNPFKWSDLYRSRSWSVTFVNQDKLKRSKAEIEKLVDESEVVVVQYRKSDRQTEASTFQHIKFKYCFRTPFGVTMTAVLSSHTDFAAWYTGTHIDDLLSDKAGVCGEFPRVLKKLIPAGNPRACLTESSQCECLDLLEADDQHVKLFAGGNCQGAFISVGIDFAESKCTSCISTCKKNFANGEEVKGAVKSFSIPPYTKVKGNKCCLGSQTCEGDKSEELFVAESRGSGMCFRVDEKHGIGHLNFMKPNKNNPQKEKAPTNPPTTLPSMRPAPHPKKKQ